MNWRKCDVLILDGGSSRQLVGVRLELVGKVADLYDGDDLVERLPSIDGYDRLRGSDVARVGQGAVRWIITRRPSTVGRCGGCG